MITRQNPVEAINVNLGQDFLKTDSANNLFLNENDLVVVRKNLDIKKKNLFH